MLSPVARVFKADSWRRSRLHALDGQPIDGRSWLDIPRVLTECAVREVFGWRPAKPWISYSAIRHLERLLRPDWRVLEFGAGMSTLWFARRCAAVYSIESDGVWYATVKALLADWHITNVHLEQRSGAPEAIDAYADLSMFPRAFFGCILIDGHARDRCVETALWVIAPGGVIFLDNTDFGVRWEVYARARQRLLSAAERTGSRATFHTGLAPAQFVAMQGLLVEWAGAPREEA